VVIEKLRLLVPDQLRQVLGHLTVGDFDARYGFGHGVTATLELPHELNQIVLFLGSEFEFEDQVEELHGIFQCQSPTVVEIRWAVLDTPQRKCLNRSIAGFVFQEPLDVEVVHLVIEIDRRRMAGGALRFAKE
jgi:hypothetical protein